MKNFGTDKNVINNIHVIYGSPISIGSKVDAKVKFSQDSQDRQGDSYIPPKFRLQEV